MFMSYVVCVIDMTLIGYAQGLFNGVVRTQDLLEIHDLVGPTKTTAVSTVPAIYMTLVVSLELSSPSPLVSV
ncbi:MFS sugar transporter [Penicillium vulpinum]|uniref:MFS sugar transporter n=1 Tax=Penicillium vulpinum TaxID=29845 RepID=UPI0025482BCC|nr:MFS sugar transporter [Penicillium vulpinum]KAJ5950166.1 MFS sugar transporter [Penicillium vulpinum]